MLTRDQFIEAWGQHGYLESWDGYDASYFARIMEKVVPLCQGFALEIGPGRGLWTRELLKHCFHLTAVDIIDQPFSQVGLRWITRGEGEYDLREIPDRSMDFVFSYGTFCHLDEAAASSYLREINRVLATAGRAIVMLGSTEGFVKQFGYLPQDDTFYIHTLQEAKELCSQAGLSAESLLDYRDHLLLLIPRQNV